MSTYTPEQLHEILDLHAKWLRGDRTGQRANLINANLRGANLRGANLTNIRSLWGTVGNMAEVKSMQVDTWPVTYTSTHMQIGCQLHPLSDWWAFDDEQIGGMDSKALRWWAKAKPMLRAWIEAYPAVNASN